MKDFYTLSTDKHLNHTELDKTLDWLHDKRSPEVLDQDAMKRKFESGHAIVAFDSQQPCGYVTFTRFAEFEEPHARADAAYFEITNLILGSTLTEKINDKDQEIGEILVIEAILVMRGLVYQKDTQGTVFVSSSVDPILHNVFEGAGFVSDSSFISVGQDVSPQRSLPMRAAINAPQVFDEKSI